MCVYLQAFTGVHSFQCRLKGKESHKTVIIMSLKRMTSGTRGHWVTPNPHLFPSLPPSGTKNPCWFSATICPSFYREARCVRVCVCVCAVKSPWRGGREGGSAEQVAVIRKEMRSDSEWETCLFSSKNTWVSALRQQSKRHGKRCERWNENRWRLVV